MALYQKIITADSAENTNEAMESWAANFTAYVSEVTGLEATYTVTATGTSKLAFILTLPVEGSNITRFGIVISTDSSVSDYMSCIIYNNSTYGYDTQGNYFDYSIAYAKRVLILKNEDTLYIMVEKNASAFTTVVALNRVTEVGTGDTYWASRGFVPTSATASTMNDLTVGRSSGAASGGVTNDISLGNAFTEDGRYMMNNLYAFHAPAMTDLPKFMKFAVEDENGDIRYALLMGSTTVKKSSTLYGGGEFLMFID